MADGVVGTAIRTGFSSGVPSESFTVNLAVYGTATDFSSLVSFVEQGTDGDYDLVFVPPVAGDYRAHWTGDLSGAEFTETWHVDAAPSPSVSVVVVEAGIWTGTFTYEGQLSTDQLQRLRWLVGDTDASAPYLYDEEYGPYLTGGLFAQADDFLAAAEVAELIANRLFGQATRMSAGGTSIDWGDRGQRFRTLAEGLRDRSSAGGSAVPYAGGLTWSDRTARESDTDRVTPFFDRDTGEARSSRQSATAGSWR